MADGGVENAGFDVDAIARRRVVRLTTTGRRSGKPRTVKIWFVAEPPGSILVQHVNPSPAHWYRNLLEQPRVEVDFGDGPRAARAEPLRDPKAVQEVLRRMRRKYPLAWLFHLIGWSRHAVAARIRVLAGAPTEGRETERA